MKVAVALLVWVILGSALGWMGKPYPPYIQKDLPAPSLQPLLAPEIALQDVPRPILPRYTFIQLGEVVCLNGTGTFCNGNTQGSIHAWYEFDDTGRISRHREDSLLYDPTATQQASAIYNREYSNLTHGTYYFLPDSKASSFLCFKTPIGFFNFTRDFLIDAKYIGITQPLGPLSQGLLAYTFLAQWILNGMPVDVTTWVLVDKPDKIYGYHFFTILYMLYNYIDMGPNGFNPSPFEQPQGVNC